MLNLVALLDIPFGAPALSVHLSKNQTLSLGRGWRAAPGEVALNGLVTWGGHMARRKIVRWHDCSVPELAEVLPDHVDLMKTEACLTVRRT